MMSLAVLTLSGCSEKMDEDCAWLNPDGYSVTASVAGVEVLTRVADRNDQTVFQTGDLISVHVDGENTGSFRYEYTGGNGIFLPADGSSNYGLWKDLAAQSSSPATVYAWYGGTGSGAGIPASVAVPTDQSTGEGYLSAIYMGASTQVSEPATCKSLDFEFSHLMAGLKVHFRLDDPILGPSDMTGSGAVLLDARNAASVSYKDGRYTLALQEATADIKMNVEWNEQNPYDLEVKCLLPPQTLAGGQAIGLTLGNGKTYTCSLQEGSSTVLTAGQITTISVYIGPNGTSVFEPKVSLFTNAPGGDFSGNRIITSITEGGNKYMKVFDRQPDGSWGNGVYVYADEEGREVFDKNGTVKIYGDIAAMSEGGSDRTPRTYYIRKSKSTGNWYVAEGPIGYPGYSIALNDRFLLSGTHLNTASDVWVFPIHQDGSLDPDEGYKVSGMRGYKLSLVENVVANGNGIFIYNEGSGKWEQKLTYNGSGKSRIATDGQRVIVQNGSDGNRSNVTIYSVRQTGGNVSITAEQWEGTVAQAGVGAPVGISGDYALSGGSGYLDLSYLNPDTGKWRKLGSFLDMLKPYSPEVFADVESLSGNNIVMKGMNALIPSDGSVYFIENIDKIVEAWLADHPL